MDSLKHILRRTDTTEYDSYYGPGTSSLLFVFCGLLLTGSVLAIFLIILRRKRVAARHAVIPQYHGRTHVHRRSASAINVPTTRNESVFVYDEKMNLIANSSNPPPTSVPQIRVTFPDDEENGGQGRPGRVVVVHVTDTGSVGMSPLQHEPAPPYQHADSERFHSLDLERIGGLREKVPTQQRYS
jgi:hypothetical protein